jgi:hypothetical protein
MLGGTTPLSNVLGAAPPATAETARLRAFAKTAASIGLHLLLVEPGGKVPVDMRSAPQRRTEDTAAQALAREAGRPDWSRVKSKGGVHLATNEPTLLGRYIDRYRKTYESDHDVVEVNFAVAVGPSRLVVVDCDTDEQVAAFLTDAGISLDQPLPPTVRSPGQQDADGNWVHYGGGHYYFTLPEDVELPDGCGSLTMPGGYAVLWAGRYVLIPPSVRAEGVYVCVGQDYPVPAWILDRIRTHAAGRTDRRQEFGAELGELATNIDNWSAMVSWEDLLEPAGWTMAARPDGCGCQVWTAPGTHASPKSATAHDTGCSYDRYSEVNAPLHIWTDNPGDELAAWIDEHGSKTISKLQLTAALSYGGDVGTACAELGVIPRDDLSLDTDGITRDLGLSTANLDEPMSAGPEQSGAFDALKNPAVDAARERAKESAEQQRGTPYTYNPGEPGFTGLMGAVTDSIKNGEPRQRSAHEAGDNPFLAPPDNGVTDPPSPPSGAPSNDSQEFTDEGGEFEDGVLELGDQFMPRIAFFDYWRDYPAPEFLIDGLIENGGMAAIIGPSGIGKTLVLLDMIASIASGQRWHGRAVMSQRGIYLPGEGMSGFLQRLSAWERAHKVNVGRDLAIGESILRAAAPKLTWERLVQIILDYRIGFLVFDTVARMMVGVEENSATETGKVIARLDEVRKLTGVTVILLHHTAKGSDSARGSSALNGALDTEILVTDEAWCDDADNMPIGKQLTVRVTKQKNAPCIEHGIPLLMAPFEDSVIITGPSGEIGDVFDEMAVSRAVTPEPSMETAVRLAHALADFTTQGLTVTEAMQAVPPDEWTARRGDVSKAWKLAMRRAIDLGLRFGLLETLSGTAAGSRYILSSTTLAAFRDGVIKAGLSD